MTDFATVSLAEVKVRTGRKRKAGDAFFVPYSSEASAEGYRPSTITQVVGTMSRANPEVRYSVRRDATQEGCFVVCIARAEA